MKGNVLGSLRAEADSPMLSTAFYKSPEYYSLVTTRDFNYVVGRRGAGKSALFTETSKFFRDQKNTFCISDVPEEYDIKAFNDTLTKIGNIDYKSGRSISHLIWQVHTVFNALIKLEKYYKFENEFLKSWYNTHNMTLSKNSLTEILDYCLTLTKELHRIPMEIAKQFSIRELEINLNSALSEKKLSVIYLIDSVDEGWEPDQVSTSNVGGLAILASKFAEKIPNFHFLIFIRDNIFRSLTYFDPDSSRNIEGNTLRISWDENKLFDFITERIRVAFSIKKENNVRVWNRFVANELKEIDGFRRCLKATLYRPRDLINLLNSAYRITEASDGKCITEEQLEKASVSISEERYRDLLKEYNVVLPGLKTFCEMFRSSSARFPYRVGIEKLNTILLGEKSNNFSAEFAYFNSAEEAFFVLYSVGFIGGFDTETGKFIFCHDGSQKTGKYFEKFENLLIHPCYWKALDLTEIENSEAILIQVNDDFEPVDSKQDIQDIRFKRLGQTIEELNNISIGQPDAQKFEEWAFKAVSIAFSKGLTNFGYKPNSDSIQRRDIVATIDATAGFWHRILEDYSTRQLAIEVKNYEKVEPADFRQLLSYCSKQYGNFGIIIRRGGDGLSDVEKNWTKTMWDEHGKIFFIVSDSALQLYLRKMRKDKGHVYVENKLNNRLDEYLRSHLSSRHKR